MLPPSAKPPSFVVHAMKDPDGVALSRLQIVKGWVGADGVPREIIHDVLVAEDGAAQLAGHWRDPDFDATRPAFYYVRVLEVERERWTTLEAARLGVDFEGDTPQFIRDRAYSSPIWYTP